MTTYISREEVIKIFDTAMEVPGKRLYFYENLYALPSLPDNSKIVELIEKKMKQNRIEEGPDISAFENSILQEILSEIKSLKN